MVKVVSFDLVGTLIDSYYEDYVWKEVIPQLFARKKGVSFEEARKLLISKSLSSHEGEVKRTA